MKKFVTPVVFVLVVAMITAYAIGQIGARKVDEKPVMVQSEETENVADEKATAETTAAEETAAAEEVTAPPPRKIELHQMPLASVVEIETVELYKLQTFADIVTKAKLEGLMTPEDGGQLTVFLPSDAGFGYMTEEARNALVNGDRAVADAFLKAHLVSGRYTLAEMAAKAKNNTLTLKTLANTTIKLVREENGPWAIETEEGLRFIMRPDVLRTNGVGQVIDAILPSK